jgi:hypothetical protein
MINNIQSKQYETRHGMCRILDLCFGVRGIGMPISISTLSHLSVSPVDQALIIVSF